jgi:hypothetical protein
MSSTRIIRTVEDILLKCPETRDNDRLLILRVWAKQKPEINETSFWGFADQFLKGYFTDTESIRRTRQKLQELKPELRGETFYLRHGVFAPKFKEELKSI